MSGHKGLLIVGGSLGAFFVVQKARSWLAVRAENKAKHAWFAKDDNYSGPADDTMSFGGEKDIKPGNFKRFLNVKAYLDTPHAAPASDSSKASTVSASDQYSLLKKAYGPHVEHEWTGLFNPFNPLSTSDTDVFLLPNEIAARLANGILPPPSTKDVKPEDSAKAIALAKAAIAAGGPSTQIGLFSL
jgi:hypothetical protein